ncbi:uncharacterized protein LOC125500964 [Athalia rosae]|uniref:uncharacterized protein LOC125500964 n=1 Tax=Athalia rosae TaxID=37344 RepID=UPI00203354D8|nr:uncharacterized protein LOC125500964 [Athalia rosae]
MRTNSIFSEVYDEITKDEHPDLPTIFITGHSEVHVVFFLENRLVVSISLGFDVRKDHFHFDFLLSAQRGFSVVEASFGLAFGDSDYRGQNFFSLIQRGSQDQFT